MLKSSLLVAGALVLAPVLTAQESEQKAPAGISEVAQKIAAVVDAPFECSFTMNANNEEEGETIQANGAVVWGTGGKFRFKVHATTSKKDSEVKGEQKFQLVSDGTTLYMFIDGDQPVTPAGDTKMCMKLPMQMITQGGGAMMGGPQVPQSKKELENMLGLVEYHLVNKTDAMYSYQIKNMPAGMMMDAPEDLKVMLDLEAKSFFPKGLNVTAKGMSMALNATGIKFPKEFKEDTFKFVPPEGVAVQDLSAMMGGMVPPEDDSEF
ncbi:MAG: hypothetical protein DWQ01_11390 [Planctomycetota bacterium]|nr:MAG: hypothetical protein DWQ01_11390 [Planctomycetota bacterium]